MATRIAKKIVVAAGGADLTVISAEDVLPYERPALTKAFLNETGPARLPGFHTSVGGGGERQNQEWYDANGVEVHLGTRVVSWDAASKTVTTDTSASFGYEKLIVAIGCTALKLPASMGGDLPGVHYVRDHADALALYDAMSKARAPVVIGGGYIGLEAAAAFAARGAKPAVVMMEPHVMARLWTPTIAAHYEALYESKGCVFHKNAKVSAIARGEDGRVKSVELEGGASLPAAYEVLWNILASVPDKRLDTDTGLMGLWTALTCEAFPRRPPCVLVNSIQVVHLNTKTISAAGLDPEAVQRLYQRVRERHAALSAPCVSSPAA